MLRTLLAAAGLTLGAAMLSPALAAEEKMPRTLSLTGHGEVRLAPDMVIVSVGVMSQAPTAAEALAANTAAMQAIFTALTSSGIAAKDIQTSNFAVQPRYQYSNDGRPPQLDGYDVSNGVTVTVRQLGSLGAVLDKVVQAGSNQINGIQFSVARPDEALDEARGLAVEDARRRAKVFAAAGRVALGDILTISENIGYPPPVPMLRGGLMKAEAMSADVPIAQGEQALSADVTIVWEIK